MNKVQKREQGDTPTTLSCVICSVLTPDKQAYDAHVNGKKHLAKVANLEKSSANGNDASSDFRCEVCAISATDAGALQLHMEGKKHLTKVAKASVTFHCVFCNVSVNNKGTGREGGRERESERMIERGRQEESKIRGANFLECFRTFLNFFRKSKGF